jgi:hypothetical protein
LAGLVCADAGSALNMRAAALALMMAFNTLFFSIVFSNDVFEASTAMTRLHWLDLPILLGSESTSDRQLINIITNKFSCAIDNGAHASR